jgi:hypothetical protein
MPSPYRSAPGAAAPIAILCKGCGAQAEVPSDATSFACAACRLAQPTFRDDPESEWMSGRTKVIKIDHAESTKLDAFARTLGLEAHCSRIELEHDGVPMAVSLHVKSEELEASGIHMGVEARGFPAVRFRDETHEDRAAKASGLAREFATGDARFDDRVYVQTGFEGALGHITPAPADGDIATVLAAPAVRAAIVQLLNEVDEVTLLPTGIFVPPVTRVPDAYDPERIHAQIRALRVLAGAPRPVRLSTVADAGAKKLRRLWVSLPVTFGALLVAWWSFPPVTNRLPLIGCEIGLALAATTRPMLARVLRGQSNSLAMVKEAFVLVLIAGAMLGPALAIAINGAFDRSTPRTHELVVRSFTLDGEPSRTKTKAFDRATGAGPFSLEFDDPGEAIENGAIVSVEWKEGALGFLWQTRPASARQGNAVYEEYGVWVLFHRAVRR